MSNKFRKIKKKTSTRGRGNRNNRGRSTRRGYQNNRGRSNQYNFKSSSRPSGNDFDKIYPKSKSKINNYFEENTDLFGETLAECAEIESIDSNKEIRRIIGERFTSYTKQKVKFPCHISKALEEIEELSGEKRYNKINKLVYKIFSIETYCDFRFDVFVKYFKRYGAKSHHNMFEILCGDKVQSHTNQILNRYPNMRVMIEKHYLYLKIIELSKLDPTKKCSITLCNAKDINQNAIKNSKHILKTMFGFDGLNKLSCCGITNVLTNVYPNLNFNMLEIIINHFFIEESNKSFIVLKEIMKNEKYEDDHVLWRILLLADTKDNDVFKSIALLWSNRVLFPNKNANYSLLYTSHLSFISVIKFICNIVKKFNNVSRLDLIYTTTTIIKSMRTFAKWDHITTIKKLSCSEKKINELLKFIENFNEKTEIVREFNTPYHTMRKNIDKFADIANYFDSNLFPESNKGNYIGLFDNFITAIGPGLVPKYSRPAHATKESCFADYIDKGPLRKSNQKKANFYENKFRVPLGFVDYFMVRILKLYDKSYYNYSEKTFNSRTRAMDTKYIKPKGLFWPFKNVGKTEKLTKIKQPITPNQCKIGPLLASRDIRTILILASMLSLNKRIRFLNKFVEKYFIDNGKLYYSSWYKKNKEM